VFACISASFAAVAHGFAIKRVAPRLCLEHPRMYAERVTS
jgi:hypothetical protein